MSYLLTWNSRIHSRATAMMAYSMANSKHKHEEYWYHNTAFSMELKHVCLDFPNLVMVILGIVGIAWERYFYTTGLMSNV